MCDVQSVGYVIKTVFIVADVNAIDVEVIGRRVGKKGGCRLFLVPVSVCRFVEAQGDASWLWPFSDLLTDCTHYLPPPWATRARNDELWCSQLKLESMEEEQEGV